MHGRAHPQTLPALRRQPPSVEASFSSPSFLTGGPRRGTAPPTQDLTRFGSTAPTAPPSAPAAAAVGAAAASGTTAARTSAAGAAAASTPTSSASAQSYGQPWNTPTTLQSVASAMTRQSAGPQSTSPRGRGGGSKGPAPRGVVAPAPPHTSATGTTGRSQGTPTEPGRGPEASLSPRTGITSTSITPEATSLEPPTDSVVITSAARAERLRELESYLQQRAGRRASLADRHKAIQKALSLLPIVYPTLTGILSTMERYMEDVAAALLRATTEKADALRQQERELYEQFETFFEGKIRELVLARQEAEQQAKAEHAAAFALREEREAELMVTKEELLIRMNACERTEDQFRDFRSLIASVFGTNQQLSMRIEQLEEVLARHRIDIPPGSTDMTAFQTSSDGRPSHRQRASGAGGGTEDDADGGGGGGGSGSPDGDGGGAVVHHIAHSKSNQVSMQFAAAAKQELVSSRLTLQEELLHSAFDDRSAYRMRIAGLTQKNLDLNFEVSELEQKVRELYTYIHEKRFISPVDENGEEVVLLTPRPHDVPLALQTELGIELRHSTANIVAELATVAINMKHQLNSALLRSRQLTTLASWLSEGTEASGSRGGVNGMLERVTEAAVIPVFPVTAWGTIPHFLRTNITPDVPNYFWTEAQAACILHNFFTAYKATRRRARFVRDGKMLSPRVYQLFEHREVLLARIDALKEDVAASVENVPFGYVVTQFARDVLSNLSPQNVQEGLPLLLPGTVALRFPKSTKGGASSAAAAAGNPNEGATSVGPTPPTRVEGRTVGVRSPTSVVGDSFPVRECPWVDAAPIVELELARFTYNMWYAAVRYQTSQPLCKLFLSLVDGQMPIDTFELMTAVAQRVRRRVEQLDVERTRRFGYARLAKGMMRAVADMDCGPGLRAVQAVAQAFEANHTPLHGGFLGHVALFADETYCLRESAVALLETEAKQRPANSAAQRATAAKAAAAAAAAAEKARTPLPSSIITHQVPLPLSLTATSPPSLLPPIGASRIVSFCRHLVLDTVEGLYSRIEGALCPLVEESEVVLGLYLLSLPHAKAALAALDDVESQEGLHPTLMGSDGAPGGGGTASIAALSRISASALAGAQLTAEAAEILGVRGVTQGYMTLLESRAGVVEEKRTVERHLTTRMVNNAVQGLPLFKTTTHFPFRCDRQAGPGSADGRAASAGTGAGEGGRQRGDAAASAAASRGSAVTAGISGGSAAAALKKGGKKSGKRKGAVAAAAAAAAAAPVVAMRRNGYLAVQGGDAKMRLSMSTPRQPGRRNSQGLTDRGAEGREGLPRPTTAELEDALRGTTLDSLLTSSAEGDLVEWYSLRHALRRTLPSLPWQIFQNDAEDGDKSSMPSASASVSEMSKVVTLRAYEEAAAH